MLSAEQTRSVLKPSVMASWFGGLSSSLGSCLGQMSHSVVSFTRHISRCTKDVWLMEYETEESNELRRKEVETTNQSITPKVERYMTCYSDLDLENQQETAAYHDLLIKGDLDIKLFIGKEILEQQKVQHLQEDTQSVNAAAGFIPATSLTSVGENIDPKASEYKHELEQKNFEMMILRERHKAMNHKFLKLQKATVSIKVTTSLVSPMPASISLGNKVNHNASEYEHQLKQQNLEMKILRERNVAMKHKLLKLQKATECLNVAAGLLPAMTSTSLGENIDPSASEQEHECELEQKNLEVKILRGRNIAMKHKLLNLQKANQCLNVAAGLVPAIPASTSLAENIDPKASEYKQKLEEQNLEMKILRGKNVAMKHKLLKLLKATQCLNVAAGLVPATSSASLGENIDPSASQCKHEVEQKNLEVKILGGGHRAMNHQLLKLENATESMNMAAGLLPGTSPSSSMGDNINHNASEYEHQLEQQNLKMKILRGRNVAMKRKLLKLQKAIECVNVAAGLLPAMTSASLGENINPNASEYIHELEQKNLEVKILRGRNVAMKHKLLNLQKTTQCLNVESGFIPTMPLLTFLGDNIDHNVSKYENQLHQENLEMKILRGRNVAMKHKLLNLQKAIQCLNEAAGLLPARSLASLGENIDPNASEYKHELERKNLEMEILRERHQAMKHKLFKLQKAIESINAAASLLPAMSSTSLGENIDPSAFECKHLEQNNLKMKILRERHGAMTHKILQVENATESINLAASLIPAMSPSTSLGDNIDHNASEYECVLKQLNIEVKILRERHGAMKCKWLKLQKATESINMTPSLIPALPASISLVDNIDHSASEYEHQLEQQNLEMKILRGRNVAMKHKLLKLQKATECLNVAAGLLPAMTSTSLGENIDPSASEQEHERELEQKNLEVKILRGRNIAMKHKLLNLQKANQCLNVAAGLVPAIPASTSLAESINHKASEYKQKLEEQNLEMKILRGRNVAMKHKLLKLLKATQCLNVAAGLVPATSSASLGENIDPNASQCKHEVEQKNLEVKILGGGHRAMNHQLLKLENATESMNMAAGLLPDTSPSSSMGDNINHNASEYEHQLEQQNLKMKILRGRNAAMKHKLLKLQKAIECVNVAAGLLPAMTSASLGENIDPSASEQEHERELEQKNLEVKILRGKNVAMKHKLLNLQKTTQCLNVAAGPVPIAPTSASVAENINHKTSECKTQLEEQNLEMKILRGRNVAMKHKLLKLLKATQCLNVAAGLVPAMLSVSLGENVDPNVSENKHQLTEKNLEMKVLRERHAAMKRKLLKLQKGTESSNAAVGFTSAIFASTSLGDNVDPSAFDHHQLELKNISHHPSSIY